MIQPIVRWLEPFIVHHGDYGVSLNLEFIEGFEMTKRLRRPLSREKIMRDVLSRIEEDETFGLAVDYGLYSVGDGFYVPERIVSIAQLLLQSGSAWAVSETAAEDNIRWRLTRRDLAAAKAAISDIGSQDERAGRSLTDAWRAIATRDPDPIEGYDKAVKAIEAAAQPVISPSNTVATLGTIIRDMKAKPSKWPSRSASLTSSSKWQTASRRITSDTARSPAPKTRSRRLTRRST
jgi:hypothetical protein